MTHSTITPCPFCCWSITRAYPVIISYFVYDSDSSRKDEYQVRYRQTRTTFRTSLAIEQIIVRKRRNSITHYFIIHSYNSPFPYENTILQFPNIPSRYLARIDFERRQLDVIQDCIFYSYIDDYYNQTCHDYRHESGA
jgi:hypothetical protein